MKVTLKPSLYSNFDDITKLKGQLLYATDTGNACYDITDDLRIDIDSTRQLDTNEEREGLENPKQNIIYIILNSNTMYRYDKTIGWLHVESFEALQDILVSASTFTPMVINVHGINFAPKTLAEYVYMSNGATLQNSIDDLMKKGSKITLEQKTIHIELQSDKIKVMEIPFPISGYNIHKFPITVLKNDVKIGIDEYAIGREQLIFTDTIAQANKKGDRITFIFSWANTIANDGLNATSINGVRIFIGDNVIDKEERINNDTWIDTYYNEIKRWNHDKQSWELIISDRKRLIKHAINIVKYKEPTNFVNIGIPNYNPIKDMLIVMKNGIPLNKNEDYKLSNNNLYITPTDGHTWDTTSEIIFTFMVLKNIPNVDYDDYNDENFDNDEKYLALQDKIASLETTVKTLIEKIK